MDAAKPTPGYADLPPRDPEAYKLIMLTQISKRVHEEFEELHARITALG